ncbi:ribbon-helix-helix protein, CopG family [Psychroserpens luteus]|uniref:Ribbon-helix-helix protein, CopG family n=1 Tax=Psychroserpens luteus TaxID=1434066 RepID=A0ABW5ZYY9_9FLAO|nr:ribbon-helix-helix protein, CopG family [Psychroserpens luteus]
MKKKGITIRIDDDLREAIEEQAKLKGKKVSEHLRELLIANHYILI